MIISVGSTLESFKSFRFHEGLNVVLSDRHPQAGERKTRNSAGKTSLIEVVHFLLGADCGKDSPFRTPELNSHSFKGSFRFSGIDWSVERTGSDQGKFFASGNLSEKFYTLLKTDKESGRDYFPLKDWRNILGHVIFDLPLVVKGTIYEESYTPSFRSMFSYFVRREYSKGFLEPYKSSENQQRWDWQENLCYLFDLDWRIPYEIQRLNLREKSLGELKKAAKQGALGDIIGTVAQLRSQVTVAEKKAAERRAQIEDFRVLDSYRELEERASRAKSKIQAISRQNVLLRENLSHLEAMIASESDTSGPDLEAVYRAVGVELPGLALRKIDDVREFYDSVVQNRVSHLSAQIEETRRRIDENLADSERLNGERQEVLSTLETHGALDDFLQLQKELAELEAEAATLKERFKAAEMLEGEKTQLSIDRKSVLQRLQNDFRDRQETIDEIIVEINEIINWLYEDRQGYFEISATEKGPEFNIRIEGNRGGGISSMEIFCFDLAMMKFNVQRDRGPGFLIHDSHLFDGVDERQIARAIELAKVEAEKMNFQYIVTLNSDIFDRLPLGDGIVRADVVLSPRLSDISDTSGLFGLRF